MNFDSEGKLDLRINMLGNFAAILSGHPVKFFPSFSRVRSLSPAGITMAHLDAKPGVWVFRDTFLQLKESQRASRPT